MTPISSLFLRITIGKDTFYWSDDKLISFDMSTNEGGKPNSISFSVHDKYAKLADKYFQVIKAQDGLDPVVIPQPNPPNQAGAAQSASNVSGQMTPHQRAFLDAIASVEAGPQGYLSVVGGGGFTSYAKHPAIRNRQLNSDAAGRYQFLSSTWNGAVASAIGAKDFSPENQDKGAIWYASHRGGSEVATAIAAGNVSRLRAILGCPGEAGCVWQGMTANPAKFDAAFAAALKKYSGTQPQQTANIDAVADGASERKERGLEISESGAQITVELGAKGKPLVTYSFLHVGLRYNLYDSSILEFEGASATVVMSRITENTSYQNCTAKQLFTQLAAKHGLRLVMNAPQQDTKYEYISQSNQTDMEFIAKECLRLGLTLKKENDTLIIEQRQAAPTDIIVRRDTVTSLSISHQAGASSKGTRSPKDSNSSGTKKNKFDILSGKLETSADFPTGVKPGDSKSTTGSNTADREPILEKANSGAAIASEQRVKGIVISFAMPLTEQLIMAKVDSAIKTEGFGADFLDRFWVLDEIGTSISSSGYSCTLSAYTPLKDKSPQPEAIAATEGTAERNANGYIAPMKDYVLTSPFGPRRSGMHKGVDLASGNRQEPIFAAGSGTVIDVQSGCQIGNQECGGRYGNRVYINHGDGDVTRYAHLTSVSVTNGQAVSQGQVLGTQGNTGSSRGFHLHFEIRRNGTAIDPAREINFRR